MKIFRFTFQEVYQDIDGMVQTIREVTPPLLVGFAPLILFITGFLMWKHRYRTKSPTEFIK